MLFTALSVTAEEKKKEETTQVLFITADHFITLGTSRRKYVVFKTNDKSVDLLAQENSKYLKILKCA